MTTETYERRIQQFEEGLRSLNYDAHCIFEDMKEGGDYAPEWHYIGFVLDSIVRKHFGGYATPEE